MNVQYTIPDDLSVSVDIRHTSKGALEVIVYAQDPRTYMLQGRTGFPLDGSIQHVVDAAVAALRQRQKDIRPATPSITLNLEGLI